LIGNIHTSIMTPFPVVKCHVSRRMSHVFDHVTKLPNGETDLVTWSVGKVHVTFDT
jgi:hypothetical protein